MKLQTIYRINGTVCRITDENSPYLCYSKFIAIQDSQNRFFGKIQIRNLHSQVNWRRLQTDDAKIRRNDIMKKKWTSFLLAVCMVIVSLFSYSNPVSISAATNTVTIKPNKVSNINTILPEPDIYYPADDKSSSYRYFFKFTLKEASEVRITGLARYALYTGRGSAVYNLTNTNGSVKEKWDTQVNADHLWEEQTDNYCDKVFILNKGTYSLAVTASLYEGWEEATWMGHTAFDYDRGFWLTINTATYTKTPVLKSVTNKAGKKIAVKYSKVAKANGYAIEYSTSKKFTKKTTVTSKKASITLKKLKKKTYYVRVRAYRLIDGKKYYGNWSSVKKVKVS